VESCRQLGYLVCGVIETVNADAAQPPGGTFFLSTRLSFDLGNLFGSGLNCSKDAPSDPYSFSLAL
jgi:hypothetical protein